MRTKPPNAARTSRNVALELGFRRCAQDLRGLLLTTPLAWFMVGWICWGRVPMEQLGGWLGGFAVSWTIALLLLTLLLRLPSPQRRRHGWMLHGAAALDGMAWAAMVPLLMPDTGANALLPWLIVLLCGGAAVTAPIYASYVRAHFSYLAGLFGVLLGHTLWRFPDLTHLSVTLGLTVFLVLLTWHIRRIGHSAEEALRQQLKHTAQNERLAGLLRVARRDAETDALTGLANRRLLDSTLSSRWQAGGLNDRRERPLSVLMLDLDHFKRVNDTHGHDVGDQILKAFAVRTSQQLRKPDLFARYGGEEFTVLLPGTDAAKAMLIAERVRAAIADMPLIAEPPVPVTVSIGVAQRKPNESTDSLLARADVALYAAKQGGRNRVMLAE